MTSRKKRMWLYRVDLTPIPSDPRPPLERLRRALKLLLRACGLRAVHVQEMPEAGVVDGEGNEGSKRR